MKFLQQDTKWTKIPLGVTNKTVATFFVCISHKTLEHYLQQ